MYSCAFWGEDEGGVHGDILGISKPNDLENAQRRKLHHVLCAARVRPGSRLLEFGTGWGALAITVGSQWLLVLDKLLTSICRPPKNMDATLIH
jgi:cyclopropane-fatty-acyl-phospholipid synthase